MTLSPKILVSKSCVEISLFNTFRQGFDRAYTASTPFAKGGYLCVQSTDSDNEFGSNINTRQGCEGEDLLGGLPGGLVCGVTPAWELVLGAREEGDMGVSVSRIKGGKRGRSLDRLIGGGLIRSDVRVTDMMQQRLSGFGGSGGYDARNSKPYPGAVREEKV